MITKLFGEALTSCHRLTHGAPMVSRQEQQSEITPASSIFSEESNSTNTNIIASVCFNSKIISGLHSCSSEDEKQDVVPQDKQQLTVGITGRVRAAPRLSHAGNQYCACVPPTLCGDLPGCRHHHGNVFK
ncbi:hypothetical protein BaRGS_00026226 [Batillaria attramentaria]|uniref:Uncharacterized protein n=1 Tax=Batillaria attramentaria TaxID=370345 RepID=A0ABD0K6E7_9CAEN